MIDRDDCIFIVVDIQEKLFRLVSKKDVLEANACRLVEFSHILGLPVLVTEQENIGPTIDSVREKLGNGYKPIMKMTFSCFGAEEFGEKLESTGKKTLVVVGMESHICVQQTVLDALDAGYAAHVVADALSSRTEENKTFAVERMRSAGAVITTTEAVMYEVMKRAGTDEFRKVLPLVK